MTHVLLAVAILLVQVWFGFGSVLRKTVGSVQFQFGFKKNLWFDSVFFVDHVSCLSRVCILWFSKCSIGLKRMFFKV